MSLLWRPRLARESHVEATNKMSIRALEIIRPVVFIAPSVGTVFSDATVAFCNIGRNDLNICKLDGRFTADTLNRRSDEPRMPSLGVSSLDLRAVTRDGYSFYL